MHAITAALVTTLASPVTEFDAWYTLSLSGTQAGWQHTTDRIEGERRIRTSTEEMRIGRANVEVTVTSKTTWTEDLKGRPISMEWSQLMAGSPVKTTWTFHPEEIQITVVQGDRTSTSLQPAPTIPWLTPSAAEELIAIRASAGAKEISWHTMLPDMGTQPVRQTMTRLSDDELKVRGRVMPVSKWGVQIEGLPVAMKTWLSTDWRPVMTTMQAPFGELRAMMCSQEEALAGSQSDAPELFMSLFIKPVGQQSLSASATNAVMRVSTNDGSPLLLPTVGAQSVTQSTDGSLELVVQLEGRQPLEGDVPGACTASSAMIAADDEVVQDLVRKATADLPADASQAQRAEAARAFVNGWIHRKGLATAFASASETARSRKGDCSEHAVLLAAMLRSMQIPARVASGLVWVDGADAFGWHMWTQAVIDGAWIDFDATLPARYSVGHILVATSNLEDGDGQRELLSLLGLLGNLNIEIVRVDQ